MAGGRPRKPSKLRELEGNRSRTEIPPDMPLSGFPECPERLTGEAKRHFDFVTAELSSIGVTKRLDTEALTLLAILFQHAMQCHDEGDTDMLCKIIPKWSALAGKFGLTPADRAKIMATPAEKADETEDRYFKVTG
jgi:phage terminase small subunit